MTKKNRMEGKEGQKLDARGTKFTLGGSSEDGSRRRGKEKELTKETILLGPSLIKTRGGKKRKSVIKKGMGKDFKRLTYKISGGGGGGGKDKEKKGGAKEVSSGLFSQKEGNMGSLPCGRKRKLKKKGVPKSLSWGGRKEAVEGKWGGGGAA